MTPGRPRWQGIIVIQINIEEHTLNFSISVVHNNDVIMSAMASQITSLTIVYSGADQRKHQSSVSLAFVRGIHRWPVNSPQKGPVTQRLFSFDDVIMDDKVRVPCIYRTGTWRVNFTNTLSMKSIFYYPRLMTSWSMPTSRSIMNSSQ